MLTSSVGLLPGPGPVGACSAHRCGPNARVRILKLHVGLDADDYPCASKAHTHTQKKNIDYFAHQHQLIDGVYGVNTQMQQWDGIVFEMCLHLVWNGVKSGLHLP